MHTHAYTLRSILNVFAKLDTSDTHPLYTSPNEPLPILSSLVKSTSGSASLLDTNYTWLCMHGVYVCVHGVYVCVHGVYVCMHGVYVCMHGVCMVCMCACMVCMCVFMVDCISTEHIKVCFFSLFNTHTTISCESSFHIHMYSRNITQHTQSCERGGQWKRC